MGRLSDEQAVKNAEIIGEWLTKLGKVRSEQVRKMFNEIGDEFYSAPASSKEEYHCCFPGGLADHSIRVTYQLMKLAGTLAPDKYPVEQLLFLGLMHDLGKVGDGEQPLYIPNEGQKNAWKREKGWLYDTNPNLIYMPVCDRSIYLLNKYGISLTDEEFIAIRISDGPLEKCNEKYGMKEPDLALLLHFADRWATAIEKRS